MAAEKRTSAARKATKAANTAAQAETTSETPEPIPGSKAARRARRDPKLSQHPALAGRPEVEIAERSPDVHEESSSRHRKVFVVPKNSMGPDYDDDMHARNIDAMRQGMILNGLRPTEDGEFVEATDHPDGRSVCLVYEVDCVPAVTATTEQSMVRVTVADNRELAQARGDAKADA